LEFHAVPNSLRDCGLAFVEDRYQWPLPCLAAIVEPSPVSRTAA
jgi:hypothetical protein